MSNEHPIPPDIEHLARELANSIGAPLQLSLVELIRVLEQSTNVRAIPAARWSGDNLTGFAAGVPTRIAGESLMRKRLVLVNEHATDALYVGPDDSLAVGGGSRRVAAGKELVLESTAPVWVLTAAATVAPSVSWHVEEYVL